jgi:magnesium transporter
MVVARRPLAQVCTKRAVVYRHGKLDVDVPFDDLAEQAVEDGALVWLDLEASSDVELGEIQDEFGLHPLAIEDIRHPKQRPKVDNYESTLLVVLFDVGFDPTDNGELLAHEVAMFVGRGFLITLHAVPIPALDAVRDRWQKDPSMVDPSPLGFLLYRIASTLIEGYFPVTDEYDTQVEGIEDRLFSRFDRNELKSLLRLRRELTQLRRIVSPQRDVFTTLARHDDDVLDSQTDAYFADLVDLVLRLIDTVDTTRDRLAAALDSFLTLQSNSLNETMKRLTGITVILTLPMIMTGVYGMNFHSMPFLDWDGGFWAMLVVTGLMMAGAWWCLKHADWI